MAGQYQRGSGSRKGSPGQPASQDAPLGYAQEQLHKWHRTVKFRRSLFGVDEADLWKKLGELNALYDQALLAERARYDALLQERLGEKGTDWDG